MEYVEGESLDKILARREKFSWEDVVAWESNCAPPSNMPMAKGSFTAI